VYFLFDIVWVTVLVVSTRAINCRERLVSEMTYYVSSWKLSPTHSLTLVSALCDLDLWPSNWPMSYT